MFHAGVRLPNFFLSSGVAGSIDQEYFMTISALSVSVRVLL